MVETSGLPVREADAVKGDNGHVLVVAGSDRYTNTPAIVSLGSLRTGVDLVTAALPGRSSSITPGFALNIISEPLRGSYLEEKHTETVLELAEDVDVLAIGPGLGREPETMAAVRSIMEGYEGKVVVDADAIHAVAEEPEVLEEETVITPHVGEFEVLTGGHPGETLEGRKDAVKEAAKDLGCTILLKGVEDIISDRDNLEVNTTGNPYMARGGTGDVLTGITAGLLAQSMDPFPAAVTAAEINGEAGEKALEENGPGFLLEDMLEEVSELLG